MNGKIIIGAVASIFIILIGIIVAYEIMNRIPESAFVRDWEEVTTMQEEGTYLVYIYQDDCPACQRIAQTVLGFYRESPEGINLFYLDVRYPNRNANFLNTLPEHLVPENTPSMIIVREGVWSELVVGETNVRNLLTSIREGEFE